MYKIFIAENIPEQNKGEMAILEGVLNSIKILGDTDVSMLYPNNTKSSYKGKLRLIDAKRSLHLIYNSLEYGLMLKLLMSCYVTFQHLLFLLSYTILGKNVQLFMKSDIWKEYINSDLIIVGHNGTFGICGGLGIFPFFSYIYLPLLRKVLNKPLIIYGGSLKDLLVKAPKYTHFLIKLALDSIDLITLRSDTSYHRLVEFKENKNQVFLTADLAFLLEPALEKNIDEVLDNEGIKIGSGPLIGMTATRKISQMANPELNDLDSRYHANNREIGEFIDYLISTLNATIIFVPHCIGYGANLDDRIVARDIFNTCHHKDHIKLIENEYDVDILKGMIGKFDFFIGERLHSVVNSMSMCVPSIIICNLKDERLDIIKMISQDDAFCDIEHLESLHQKFNQIWQNRELIRKNLRTGLELVREKSMLNGSLLAGLLKG